MNILYLIKFQTTQLSSLANDLIALLNHGYPFIGISHDEQYTSFVVSNINNSPN